MEIPKIIHIIWFGGALRLEHQGRIVEWATQNPDYEVKLWINDTVLAQKLADQLRAEHQARAAAPPRSRSSSAAPAPDPGAVAVTTPLDEATWTQLESGQISRADLLKLSPDRLAIDNFARPLLEQTRRGLVNFSLNTFESVSDSMQMARLVQLESIPALNPVGKDRGVNYGQASDIFRVELLIREGGIYFDTDIKPQRRLGTIDIETGFGCHIHDEGKGRISPVNCILASTRDNGLMKNYRASIEGNYRQVFPDIRDDAATDKRKIMLMRDYADRRPNPTTRSTPKRDMTLAMTGPGALMQVLRDSPAYQRRANAAMDPGTVHFYDPFRFPTDNIEVTFEESWSDPKPTGHSEAKAS